MIKVLTVVLTMIVVLSGCGGLSRISAYYSGYDVQCVDGVAYIQFTSGVTVKYERDGQIAKCK